MLSAVTFFDQLLLIFAFFLVAIAIFAAVYARLYKESPRHFVFNADIVQRQREVSLVAFEQELFQLRKILKLVLELQPTLMRGEVSILAESAPGNVIYKEHAYSFITSPPGYSVPTLYLRIFDLSESLVAFNTCFSAMSMPTNLFEFQEAIGLHIRDLKEKCARLEKRLASVPTEEPQIWGFWDFLYFSVVIQ